MIRFTSGSVFKAISLCKTGRKFSDNTLADILFPIKFTTGYIGHVKDCTKAAMIAMTSVDPIEFLANTLFGICSQQTNTEGKHSIKELNTDYIENRKEKASHISFILSTAILDNAVPKLNPSFAGDDHQILYETSGGNHVVVL